MFRLRHIDAMRQRCAGQIGVEQGDDAADAGDAEPDREIVRTVRASAGRPRRRRRLLRRAPSAHSGWPVRRAGDRSVAVVAEISATASPSRRAMSSTSAGKVVCECSPSSAVASSARSHALATEKEAAFALIASLVDCLRTASLRGNFRMGKSCTFMFFTRLPRAPIRRPRVVWLRRFEQPVAIDQRSPRAASAARSRRRPRRRKNPSRRIVARRRVAARFRGLLEPRQLPGQRRRKIAMRHDRIVVALASQTAQRVAPIFARSGCRRHIRDGPGRTGTGSCASSSRRRRRRPRPNGSGSRSPRAATRSSRNSL